MDIVKSEERLKSVLVSDKEETPNKILNVLKSDVLNVLKQYMEISGEELSVDVSINQFGQFVFCAQAISRRLKNLSYSN